MDYGWERGVTGNFPIDLAPSGHGTRGFIEGLEGMDTPFRESLGDEGAVIMSELKRNQTPREYYDAVEKAIATGKIDRQKLNEAREDNSNEEFARLILPIYIELRAQGYNNADLFGYLK